ncbi:hypothetical protein ACQPZ2_01955 [Nocardia pseudovaccinii]|uniref:hypothetical protein n=1 Tax=Nocardia pseudovaccinii TaxID=189540 RepID=UPI003D8E8F60
MAQEDTIVVFTAKSPQRIIREGGSEAWRLDIVRARRCEWLLVTQNRHNPGEQFDANQSHGSGFLLGRISRIIPAVYEPLPERWMIRVSEYALIEAPNAWGGWRNPVRYTSLEERGISLDSVDFVEMPDPAAPAQPSTAPAPAMGLTIVQAKAGLAATYGVETGAIEIIIRG